MTETATQWRARMAEIERQNIASGLCGDCPECKIKILRAEVEALRQELPSCDGCGHPAVDHEGHPLAVADKGACEQFESTSDRLTAELKAAQRDAARLREALGCVIAKYEVYRQQPIRAFNHANETQLQKQEEVENVLLDILLKDLRAALTAPTDPTGGQ